ncbi:MAG TPA: curli assembly protein CsgF [Castellaniella sp.]|uniref:curli assembly protein CsgF n=1 Tax=Castellaniella sp. TaxID=1955812 RepID=UPI002F17BD80
MKYLHVSFRWQALVVLLSTSVVAFAVSPAFAAQLTYKPVNPSFGGDAFNGSFLMGIAQQESSRSSPNPLASLDLSSLSDLGGSLDRIGNQLEAICSATASCKAEPSTLSSSQTP